MDSFAYARAAALDALGGDAVSRITAYYQDDGDFAGALFLSLEPNDPKLISPADLFAVTLLNVHIGHRAAGHVLTNRQVVTDLRAVPDHVQLECADDAVLDAAGECYETLKRLFVDPTAKQSRPWVAPAKLLARKRPHLIPVRDGTVRLFLGIMPPYSYREDWDIYRGLMRDEEVRARLAELPALDPPLRMLDVALWTKACR